jgi:hypothetical protein
LHIGFDVGRGVEFVPVQVEAMGNQFDGVVLQVADLVAQGFLRRRREGRHGIVEIMRLADIGGAFGDRRSRKAISR